MVLLSEWLDWVVFRGRGDVSFEVIRIPMKLWSRVTAEDDTGFLSPTVKVGHLRWSSAAWTVEAVEANGPGDVLGSKMLMLQVACGHVTGEHS
jgi:hypothetical protein